MHKLGQLLLEKGKRPFKALRAMEGGSEVQEFDCRGAAERWILQSNSWGSLEESTDEARGETLSCISRGARRLDNSS